MTAILTIVSVLFVVLGLFALMHNTSKPPRDKSIAIPAGERDYILVVEHFARQNQQMESFLSMLTGQPERPPYTFKGNVLHSGAGISDEDMANEGKRFEKELGAGAEIFEIHENGKPDVFLLLDIIGEARAVDFEWGNQRYEEGVEYPLPGSQDAEGKVTAEDEKLLRDLADVPASGCGDPTCGCTPRGTIEE